jgi:anti-sigma B factor antagonist
LTAERRPWARYLELRSHPLGVLRRALDQSLVTIESLRRGAAATLMASGELDVSSAPALNRAIDDALASNPRQLEIDLSELSYIDSAGLRVLMRAKDSCDEKEVELHLVESRHRGTRMVFEATGLGGLLRLGPKREDSGRDAAPPATYGCEKCGRTWTGPSDDPPAKCPSCFSRRISRQATVDPAALEAR